MLNFLKVKNLAIVENAQVSFDPGLNVITGETGSGKSVIIGALSLILGDRADHGAVRSGEKELVVEASFSLDSSSGVRGPAADAAPAQADTARSSSGVRGLAPDHLASSVDAILDEAGLPPCEDGQLLVRRLVSASGGGKCWINDSPSTVATLRRIGALLIDMHGPYDHQSLLSPEFQLSLLDSFGRTEKARSAYSALFSERAALLAERASLLSESGDDIAAEIDRLSFIVSEIDDAALGEDDGEPLVERHRQACNANSILEQGGAILSALTDGEDSVFDKLAAVQHGLSELARILPDAGEWHEEAASAAIAVQELSRTISDKLSDVDSDPEALAALEARMELVHRLKRKYGQSLDDIAARRDAAKERLDRLLFREKRLAALDGEIAGAEARMRAAGKALSDLRAKAGRRLAAEITKELKPLGFAQSVFEVSVVPREPVASGMDEAVFSFAPNPGEPTMPLKDVASSGEIARVMLATKSVLAEHDSIPLLVFDEIDSNIGGEVGRAVGEKLLRLSKTHQIVCITHLPQVAAFGDAHYSVAKHVEGNRTLARITPLGTDARVTELARMLGGNDITAVVSAHARELLALSGRVGQTQ